MTNASRLTLRHAALLVVVFCAGVLLGANVTLPVNVRFPGLLVLAALAVWLVARGRPRVESASH